MRAQLSFLATLGFANARGLMNRQPQGSVPTPDTFQPKTDHPEFFNIRVDPNPECSADYNGTVTDPDCTFNNYAVRLLDGKLVATPYNDWYDPQLPIFFVDDDTKLYTVSKQPLEIYVSTVDGSLLYTRVGWLPPNSIAISFYRTGNNPRSIVGPSPSYLSWPSTQGENTALFGDDPWWLCPYGTTGDYQVFVNNANFGLGVELDGGSGVAKNPNTCKKESLAALNANPYTNTRRL